MLALLKLIGLSNGIVKKENLQDFIIALKKENSASVFAEITKTATGCINSGENGQPLEIFSYFVSLSFKNEKDETILFSIKYDRMENKKIIGNIIFSTKYEIEDKKIVEPAGNRFQLGNFFHFFEVAKDLLQKVKMESPRSQINIIIPKKEKFTEKDYKIIKIVVKKFNRLPSSRRCFFMKPTLCLSTGQAQGVWAATLCNESAPPTSLKNLPSSLRQNRRDEGKSIIN